MNSRRTFVITAVSCGSAIATGLMTGNAMAQAKLDEKDAQAVALGYVADTTKADKKNIPSTRTIKNAQIANCFKAKQPMLLVVAHFSLANKWLAQVGAAHGLRKPNLNFK
jgi:hypothetical protein